MCVCVAVFLCVYGFIFHHMMLSTRQLSAKLMFGPFDSATSFFLYFLMQNQGHCKAKEKEKVRVVQETKGEVTRVMLEW